jgi:hypothetical protein
VNEGKTFEDRLLAVLEAEVTQTAARAARDEERNRGRRVRIASLTGAGTLAVIAALAAPALLGDRDSSAAWAVETRADGSVNVHILEYKDPAGLERRLAELGIPAHVTFVPYGMVCNPESHRADIGRIPDISRAPGSRGQTLVIGAGEVRPNERLRITAYADDGNADDGNAGLGYVGYGVVPFDEERCLVSPTFPPGWN